MSPVAYTRCVETSGVADGDAETAGTDAAALLSGVPLRGAPATPCGPSLVAS
jgi:hypothetical protein